MFSVEMYATHNVLYAHQCFLVLRYPHEDTVLERLMLLAKGEGASEKVQLNLLKFNLDRFVIKTINCLDDSFDGAANRSGEYKGVQARLKEVSANHLYGLC